MKEVSISGVEVGGKKLSSDDYTISGNAVTIHGDINITALLRIYVNRDYLR